MLHETSALSIQWQGSETSVLRWQLSDKPKLLPGGTVDSSQFNHLSLRASRIFDSPLNTDAAIHIRIRLSDMYEQSADVLIGTNITYRINTPKIEKGIFHTRIGGVNTITNSLSTIRIPLNEFIRIDLSRLRSLRLIVGADSGQGAIVIDSIELTR